MRTSEEFFDDQKSKNTDAAERLAKRAVALLYQLNTPRAIELLRGLAAKGPDNELAVMAADALARVEARARP